MLRIPAMAPGLVRVGRGQGEAGVSAREDTGELKALDVHNANGERRSDRLQFASKAVSKGVPRRTEVISVFSASARIASDSKRCIHVSTFALAAQ